MKVDGFIKKMQQAGRTQEDMVPMILMVEAIAIDSDQDRSDADNYDPQDKCQT